MQVLHSTSDAALLRRAVGALTRRLRSRDDAADIGSTGLGILASLLRCGPASASELALRERLQPQSLTRALAALEKDRLIARSVAPDDRRRSSISITPKGEARLRATLGKRVAWLAHAMDTLLNEAERETLRAAAGLIERIADADERLTRTPLDFVFNLIPYAHVTDVERSRQFYERLGFVEDGRTQIGDHPVWISLHARTVRAARITLVRADCALQPNAQTILFYCWTDAITALRERLIREGVAVTEITYPDRMPDGEFRLADPDGYAVIVGQPRR
jgi:DNA-binding MarR family transcriptional regulator/catechol 2,3-dioxygenase-like lactoylglutathione lyase family enzyme